MEAEPSRLISRTLAANVEIVVMYLLYTVPLCDTGPNDLFVFLLSANTLRAGVLYIRTSISA